MKRPRKFYRDKEYRRRILESNNFNAYFEYYDQKGYVTVYIISKKARKHPLYKAFTEILPLLVIKQFHLGKEPPELVVSHIHTSLYVKLKAEHKLCFQKQDKEIFEYRNIEANYYLLPELDLEFLIHMSQV